MILWRSTNSGSANFNFIARPYRWLEYAFLGPLLQRTRTHFLLRLNGCRRALLFGDGDGRFLAELLKTNPDLSSDAVDTSAAMLRLLQSRAQRFAQSHCCSISRLRTHNRNALDYIPDQPNDLVVTHFFLDCLIQPEVDRLFQQLVPTLAPNALWVVSEFRVPPGVLHAPATLFIRTLYLAFWLLTGLRVTQLPDHHSPLVQAGFLRIAHSYRLFGILASELWQKQDRASSGCDESSVGLSSHIT